MHHRTFKDDNEIQQLILPLCLCDNVLQSLHNDNGHQGLQHVINLLHVTRYIGLPCLWILDRWISQCEWCLVSKGDYTEPKTLQGSLVANQPLELLCIDFTKADVTKGGQREHLTSH